MSVKSELLAAIYADPSSDDARIVFADFLMGEGDPRGDMIAKQLAGDDAGAQPLLEQYGGAWLGSLRQISDHVQFRRGFPARLSLTEVRGLGRPAVDRIAEDLALGTIEHLEPGRAHPAIYARLIASPAMTGLRRIEVDDDDVVWALRQSPARITHATHAVYRLRTIGAPPDRDSFAEFLAVCDARPVITSIGFDSKLVDMVVASPLCARLRSVEVFERWPGIELSSELPRVWQQLPHDLRVTFGLGAANVAGRYPDRGAIELARENGEIIARARGQWGHLELARYVRALPADVARLEVDGEPDTELQLVAADRELELCVVPRKPIFGFVRTLDFPS
jgi:uncharacterized protein (TIGR02996 family)